MGTSFTVDISLDAILEDLAREAILAGTLEPTQGSRVAKIPIDLVDGVWKSVDVGDVTPWAWIVVNTHATTPVDIGFGQGTPIRVAADSIPQIWTGDTIPSFRADGAAGSVLVIIIEA